jgi:hypothetical protein
MKRFLLFFCITILIISCSSNKKKAAKEEINYYKLNKIKRVEKYQYDYKFGVVDSSSKELVTVNEYDTMGNKIKDIYYSKNNSIPIDNFDGIRMDSTVTILKYDLKGNNISTIGYDKIGKISHKDTTTYNEFNDAVDFVSYDENGDLMKTIHYVYDNNGYLISSTRNELKSKLILIDSVLQRDGNIEKEKILTDEKSNLIFRETLKVHNDSTEIYEKYYGLDKSIYRTERKLYKKINIGFKLVDVSTNKDIWGYLIKLNEMNLPIEENIYTEGEPSKSKFIKYVYFKF